MKKLLIIFSGFIPLVLSGCGRKVAPKPPEGVEVIYPSTYPKPNCEIKEKKKKKSSSRFKKKK